MMVVVVVVGTIVRAMIIITIKVVKAARLKGKIRLALMIAAAAASAVA